MAKLNLNNLDLESLEDEPTFVKTEHTNKPDPKTKQS